jgi:peroxiredoxin
MNSKTTSLPATRYLGWYTSVEGSIVLWLCLMLITFFAVCGSVRADTAENGNYSEDTPENIDLEIDEVQFTMAIGEIAPDFSSSTASGRVFTLSDYIGVKPVVIVEIDAWAPSCHGEMEAIQEFYETYSDEIAVVAFPYVPGTSAEDISRITDYYDLTFPFLLDPLGEINNLYQSDGVPYYVFIDLDGVVTGHMVGHRSDLTLEEYILGVFGMNESE